MNKRTWTHIPVPPYYFVAISVNINKNINKFVEYAVHTSQLPDEQDRYNSSRSATRYEEVGLWPTSEYYLYYHSGRVTNIVSGSYKKVRKSKPPDKTIVINPDILSINVDPENSTDRLDVITAFTTAYKFYTGYDWDGPSGDPKKNKYVHIHTEPPLIIHTPVYPPLDPRITEFIENISTPTLYNILIYEHTRDENYPLGVPNKKHIKLATDACAKLRRLIINGADPNLLYELSQTVMINFPAIFNKKVGKLGVIETMDVLEWYEIRLKSIASQSNVITYTHNDAAQICSLFPYNFIPVVVRGPEGNMLRSMVANTQGLTYKYKVILLDAYRVVSTTSPESELDHQTWGSGGHSVNFEQLEDHRLLFHGTGPSNLVKILKDGLYIPKIYAVTNGSTLGKGIYFADCITKSFQYCVDKTYGWGSAPPPAVKNKNFYVLVCEVAIGHTKIVQREDNDVPINTHTYDSTTNETYAEWTKRMKAYEKNPLPDYDSKVAMGVFQGQYEKLSRGLVTRITGVPDSGQDHYTISIPVGVAQKLIYDENLKRKEYASVVPDTTSFYYNEYCIFNKSQYRIRYILKLTYEEKITAVV